MSDIVKGLLEKRANIWEGLKATLDGAETEGRDLTVEEQTSFEQRNGDLDALDARIKGLLDAQQRNADIEASMRSVARQPEVRTATADRDELRSFLQGEGGRSFEVRAGRRMGTEEFRALVKGTATAGGNTVPTSFYDRLVAHLIEVSSVLQAGPTILNTASGEALQIPKTTAHGSGALVAEAATIAASDPTFGQVTLNAYKYGMLITISHELLNDTAVDLEGYLAMQAGRALGNVFGAHLVTGTGSSQPAGIVTGASAGVTGGTGVSGAFTADNLMDLYYSVIAPYRASKSAAWLMRDASVAVLRKIKDSTGQYLWQPALTAGNPDTILGKPLYTDPGVAAVALNAKSVVFGDFSQYYVRLVEGLRFERSDDFKFDSDQVTFRALLRGDGVLVDQTGALKVFVGAAS